MHQTNLGDEIKYPNPFQSTVAISNIGMSKISRHILFDYRCHNDFKSIVCCGIFQWRSYSIIMVCLYCALKKDQLKHANTLSTTPTIFSHSLAFSLFLSLSLFNIYLFFYVHIKNSYNFVFLYITVCCLSKQLCQCCVNFQI